ncbi:MAG: tRNA (cytidine(34)-2'-O)-methyltransferase [Phycisphaerales bacterium]|nr:tRNA (cytidine(34)-2'-O)-methyltransferase [Phycisphaerales bacterium]
MRPHNLKIVLMQPCIAPNTGNIARLAVATGCSLHLVRPLGFVLDDRTLRRSAMDYWPRLKLTIHDDDQALWDAIGNQRPWLISSKGAQTIWQATFTSDDWLIFGNEPRGLTDSTWQRHGDRALRIPQTPGERCLNLSTAAGIALYEALRQIA